MNEKESSNYKISELEQVLDKTKQSYENQLQQLESKANLTNGQLKKNIKDLEFLLEESEKRSREFEEISKSKFQSWNHKKYTLQSIMDSQLQTMQVYNIPKWFFLSFSDLK